MEPDDEMMVVTPEIAPSGRRWHGAGAGLGFVWLMLGFGTFAMSIIIGFYLWGALHSFKLFLYAAAFGAAFNFVMRRLALR